MFGGPKNHPAQLFSFNLNPMSNRTVYIGSPCKGSVPHHYVLLFERLKNHGIPGWDIQLAVEASQSALNISRNILAHDAIKSGADRMIMLDLDHPVDLPHFARILSHDDERYPIVSAMYCMKKPGNPFFLGIRVKGAVADENMMLPAAFLPTGFLSVSIAALKKIAAAHPEREFYVQKDKVQEVDVLLPAPKITNECMMEFFPIGVNGPRTANARMRQIKKILEPVIKRGGSGFFAKHQIQQMFDQILNAATEPKEPGYLAGEDYYFSLLANQAGVPQFLDNKLTIPHRGTIDYPITDEKVLAKTCTAIPSHEGDIDTW